VPVCVRRSSKGGGSAVRQAQALEAHGQVQVRALCCQISTPATSACCTSTGLVPAQVPGLRRKRNFNPNTSPDAI